MWSACSALSVGRVYAHASAESRRLQTRIRVTTKGGLYDTAAPPSNTHAYPKRGVFCYAGGLTHFVPTADGHRRLYRTTSGRHDNTRQTDKTNPKSHSKVRKITKNKASHSSTRTRRTTGARAAAERIATRTKPSSSSLVAGRPPPAGTTAHKVCDVVPPAGRRNLPKKIGMRRAATRCERRQGSACCASQRTNVCVIPLRARRGHRPRIGSSRPVRPREEAERGLQVLGASRRRSEERHPEAL